ncbi:MAG: twitching motility protein PilT [Bradymonadia bacterium]|jgi:twitching motility protein PilT
MARIDPLLKMIVAQGGNEMVLRANEQPQLFHSGSHLRLFLPPMAPRLIGSMLEPLLDADAKASYAAGDETEFTHENDEFGTFKIRISNPGETIAVRIDRVQITPDEVAQVPAAGAGPLTQTTGPLTSATTLRTTSGPRIVPPKLVTLITMALERRASDIHLADDEPPVLRIDGTLIALADTLPVTPLAAALLTDHERSTLNQEHAVDLSFALPGQARIRGHVYRHAGGLAAAFRVLARKAPTLSTLNLPVDLSDLADGGPGLIIVSGPTGSGKSTTLAALAQAALSRRGGLLITLEDPIEHVYDAPAQTTGLALVRQRAIGEHTPSFATGLRAALREDPDVLLVGEMRDAESILHALTAAETGHLVLTTLHSRDTASAIARMLDAVPPERQSTVRGQLAAALKAIVAQRLVPKATGTGRVPVLEVLRPTTGVRALIRDGKLEGIASALQSGGGEGLISLARCAANQVKAGVIRRKDAEALLDNPTTLRSFL